MKKKKSYEFFSIEFVNANRRFLVYFLYTTPLPALLGILSLPYWVDYKIQSWKYEYYAFVLLQHIS